MTTLVWFVLIALLAVYLAVILWWWNRGWQKWEAEYAETKARKAELEAKMLPQPYHCPYCGEEIPRAIPEFDSCPKCGRLVMAQH